MKPQHKPCKAYEKSIKWSRDSVDVGDVIWHAENGQVVTEEQEIEQNRRNSSANCRAISVRCLVLLQIHSNLFDYALTKGIPFALVKNPTGNFIEPSLDSTQEAVSNAVALSSLPAGDKSWMKVSMLKAPGPKSYPIASFSYLLLYKEMSADQSIDQTKAKTLVSFISWAISDGQRLAANLGYVPLPARVVKGDQDTLRLLTFKGMPLYAGP